MVDPAANDQVVVEHAAAVERTIVAARRQQRGGWVGLASLIYEFHENRYWELLGYDSLSEWLAAPEVEMTRHQFYDYVRVWRELVVARGVVPGRLTGLEFTKLRDVLPHIISAAVDLEEALADAEVLSRRDLEEKYRGDPGAALDAGSEPITCPICGQKVRSDERARRVHEHLQSAA